VNRDNTVSHSLISPLSKEDVIESLLHLSKQITYYNNKGKNDGSIHRFFSNNLSLVLAAVLSDELGKSIFDLRDIIKQVENRWIQGLDVLRSQRASTYNLIYIQLDHLEILKNASIAQQSEIQELIPSFHELVNYYQKSLSHWYDFDVISQKKKLNLKLNALTVFSIESSKKSQDSLAWFQKIKLLKKDIDVIELIWGKIKLEARLILNNLIEQRSLDPIASIAHITGDMVNEMGTMYANRVLDGVATFFLEKRAGISKFDFVPDTLFAKYLWNPESSVRSLSPGTSFALTAKSTPEVTLHGELNDFTQLNNQTILKKVLVVNSEGILSKSEDDVININTEYPSKFRLDQTKKTTDHQVSPFYFQIKSPLFGLQGNVLKWTIGLEFDYFIFQRIYKAIFDSQPNLKQVYGEDSPNTVIKNWIFPSMAIFYQTLDGVEYEIPLSRIELSVFIDKASETSSISWSIIIDGDNPPPLVNSKGDVELRFKLKRDFLYSYGFFSHNKLNRILINIDVLSVGDVQIYNDFGKIEPSTPFNPFGTKPELGSRFFIGHPMLFSNALNNLKITWQWYGLTDAEGGLSDLYKKYGLIESDDDFMVAVSALRSGTWFPETERQLVPLFASDLSDSHPIDSKPTVSNIRRINEIDLLKLDLNRPQKSFENLKEPFKSKYGYIALELVSPVGAFGHGKFSENLQKKVGNPKMTEYLPEPYTPTLGNLVIDASLQESITTKDFKDRITSFGIDHYILNKEASYNDGLMPQDNHKSSIYLNLSEFSNTSAALFFELPSFRSGKSIESPKEWYWYDSAQLKWNKIVEENIVTDDTLNFETSGQILIQNLTQSEELPWIKVVSPFDTSLSWVQNIDTQIIKLELTENPLFDKKITLTNIEIPEFLGEVMSEIAPYQQKDLYPVNLFSNKTALYSFQFRLQNKISSFKDLREFLLVKFPKIQDLLVLSHKDEEENWMGGLVRVVVIPKSDISQLMKAEWSRLTSKELRIIEHFLNTNAPLGCKFQVENPIYEELIIKCNITIAAGMDKTEAREKLHRVLLEGTLEQTGAIETGFSFGKSLYSSKLLSILRSQSFVTSVTNFAVYTRFDDYLKLPSEFNSLNYQVDPSKISHVLIPSKKHLLDIKDANKHASDGIGVSNMTLETDFLVDRLQDFKLRKGVGKLKVGYTFKTERNSNNESKIPKIIKI
jgi:hypothetical protein